MRYDTQIGELKNRLDAANSLLVVLPREINIDKLAAALSLYLSLKQAGKTVSIVCEADPKVSQTALFGIGDIRNQLPESNSGNFIMKLDGVVEGGKVPALVNLDWYPTGSDLNLVFHVAQGKKFEPINISHHYDTTTFQIIFFVGAPALGDFGGIYTANIDKLGDAVKVNIDNTQNNTLFGQVNITDPDTASLSEVTAQILQGLSLPQDGDVASNIITGIYEATNNLTVNVTSDTFMTVGAQMQMGGKVPFIQAQLNQGGFDISQFRKDATVPQESDDQQVAASVQQASEPAGPEVQQSGQSAGSVDPQATDTPLVVDPPADNTQTLTPADPAEVPPSSGRAVPSASSLPEDPGQAKSQYEVPTGEQVTSGSTESPNPAPDWLTPKIFKGGGLG